MQIRRRFYGWLLRGTRQLRSRLRLPHHRRRQQTLPQPRQIQRQSRRCRNPGRRKCCCRSSWAFLVTSGLGSRLTQTLVKSSKWIGSRVFRDRRCRRTSTVDLSVWCRSNGRPPRCLLQARRFQESQTMRGVHSSRVLFVSHHRSTRRGTSVNIDSVVADSLSSGSILLPSSDLQKRSVPHSTPIS